MNFKKKILLTIIILNILIATLSKIDFSEKDKTYEEIKPSISVDNEVNDKLDTSNTEIQIMDSLYDEEISLDDINVLKNKIFVNNISQIINNIKDVNVYYPYQELYCEQYKQYPEYNSEVFSITTEDLYKIVIKNNEDYQNRYAIDNYSNTTDEFVYEICSMIISRINYLNDNNVSLDYNRIMSNLKLLKIFEYNGYNYGYYNDEKSILGINTSLSKESLDVRNDIINHEINHLLSGSNKEYLLVNNLKSNTGFMYNEGNDINPYNWVWFSEAICELLSYQYSGLKEPFVYNTNIKSIETIKLSLLDTSNQIERTLFSDDINDLYEVFKNLDKNEVNKMFYAFTVIFDNNIGQEGYNFYTKILDYEPELSYSELELQMKSSCMLSLSKEFYINLLNKLNENTATLEEIFKTIQTFELELSRQLWYQSKYGDLEYFLENYCNIQEEFFKCLNMDIEYVKELYVKYNNQGLNELHISWLSDEVNKYIAYINESRLGNEKDAILKVYADFYSKMTR